MRAGAAPTQVGAASKVAATVCAVTSDAVMRTRMERAAAAAQLLIDVRAELPSAGAWLRSPVVLLDSVVVEAAADAGLPKRDRVLVVAGSEMAAAQWQACVAIGAGTVVAADDPDYQLVQLLADATDSSPGGSPGQIVAVIGACGGVGSSAFAAALALVAAEDDRQVVLCDADSNGSGLEITLGMEGASGARWRDISASHGRIPEGVLRKALPVIPHSRDGAVLLGFGRASDVGDLDSGVVQSVLDAVRRSGETAVVDLPRYGSAAAERAIARADLTVLLAPAEVRGCYASARLVPTLSDLGARLGLVVRGPSPGGIGAGDVSAALGIPLIAAMRPQPGLSRSIDSGLGLGATVRGPLRRAALKTLDHLEKQV